MNGALAGSIFVAGGRNDAHQRVVHRPLQRAAVAHEFSLEGQHVRDLLGALLQVGVAALAQHVEEQHDALPGVQPVLLDGAHVRPI